MISCTDCNTKAEMRRAQILAAASDCFRRQGFHAASIAQISRAAGMSPGHIYHYFQNKEAIVAAIVAQDLDRLMRLTQELRKARDGRSAIIERVAQGVSDNLNPDAATIKLEIVAEAARNPKVAAIVQDADITCRQGFKDILDTLVSGTGSADREADLEARVEVLSAMFEGLMIRSVRNPNIDRKRVVTHLQSLVLALLHSPHDDQAS
jgi:AcrR family transcriptional regulator